MHESGRTLWNVPIVSPQAGKVMEADKAVVDILTKVTPYKAKIAFP